MIRKLVAIAKGYFYHGSTQVPDVSVWDDEPASGNLLWAIYQNGKCHLKERLGIGINPPVYRLHVVVNQDDRIAIVQTAEQASGVWIEKAVPGGSQNCQWQILIPSGEATFAIVSNGTTRMKFLSASGHVEMPAGVFKMSTLVADRPLKLDSGGYMTHGKIKLNDANEVQGAVQIANGGTGATSVAGARAALSLDTTDSPVFAQVSLSNLGTAAPLITNGSQVPVSGAIQLGNANHVSGTLAVGNGGTGATNAAGALTSLGAAAASHSHTLTLSTATINYKDHSGANQSLTVVTNVGIV